MWTAPTPGSLALHLICKVVLIFQRTSRHLLEFWRQWCKVIPVFLGGEGRWQRWAPCRSSSLLWQDLLLNFILEALAPPSCWECLLHPHHNADGNFSHRLQAQSKYFQVSPTCAKVKIKQGEKEFQNLRTSSRFYFTQHPGKIKRRGKTCHTCFKSPIWMWPFCFSSYKHLRKEIINSFSRCSLLGLDFFKKKKNIYIYYAYFKLSPKLLNHAFEDAITASIHPL